MVASGEIMDIEMDSEEIPWVQTNSRGIRLFAPLR